VSWQRIQIQPRFPLMQIKLIAVGSRMPEWVNQGYAEYARRLSRDCALQLQEIPAGKRLKNTDIARLVRDEGERMMAVIPYGSHIVSLDIAGRPWSTRELAEAMRRWLASGQNVALLVGGPEGLSDSVREQAHESWSLSRLTFPHPLVRIVVAEQLYRAWSILQQHPYHR